MSLTWFPFHADAYTGDTGHLTCEEHGAYLLLMLAYYRSEKPLPARDRSLAATCKLSLEAWMEAKHSLAPFFVERDGLWHHETIDATIKDSNERVAKTLENAKAGAAKRWKGHTKKDAARNAARMPEAKPEQSTQQSSEQCDSDAHLHLQSNSLSAREREIDLVDEGSQEPPAPTPGIGSPIDPEFKPMGDWVAETIEEGFTETEIYEQVKLWIAHKLETGSFSADWDASWVKGWNNYKIWKAKQKPAREKAAPRIEVNHAPSTKDFEFGLKMISTGGMWPKYLGPHPGLHGCLCPAELIQKHGIDPNTGLVVRS